MGATSLKSAKSRGFTSYNIVRKDSSRGFWQFIDNQTSTEYLLKEVSQKEVPSLEQFVQKKAMLQHDNLVSIKDYLVDAAAGVACLLYEFPLRSLHDEMAERRMFSMPYKEGQIWSVIKAVILGMAYLDKKNIDEKIVRLNTIYIGNNGSIKVADPWIMLTESSYQLAIRHKSLVFPLSPEEIVTIQQNIQTNVGRKKNSDVYSLGMCMLEMALVGSHHRIQHYSNYEVYRKSISIGLDICRNRLSQELISIIGLMLEVNAHERVGWAELADLIETSASRRVSVESVESCTKTANFALERRQSMEKMDIMVTNVSGVVTVNGSMEQKNSEMVSQQMRSQAVNQSFNSQSVRASQQPVGQPTTQAMYGVSQPNAGNGSNYVTSGFNPQRLPPRPEKMGHLQINTQQFTQAYQTTQQTPQVSAVPQTRIAPQIPQVSQAPQLFPQVFPPQQPSYLIQMPFSNPSLPPTAVPPTNIKFNIHSVSSPTLMFQDDSHNQSVDRSQNQWRSSMKNNRILASNISRERNVDSNKGSRLETEQSLLRGAILPAVLESLGSQVRNVIEQTREQLKMPQGLMSVMPQILENLTMPAIRQTVSLVQPQEQPEETRKKPISQPVIMEAPTAEPAQHPFVKQVEEKSDNSRTPINSIIFHDKSQFLASNKFYKSIVQEHPRESQAEKSQPIKEVYDRQSIIISKIPQEVFKQDTPNKQSIRVEAEVQTTPGIEYRKIIEETEDMEKTVRYEAKYEPPKPRYEGDMLRGFRHGKGKYYFEDGGYYDGQWLFNRMQGKGKLYYMSGKLAYEGEWSQDQIHGQGKLYNENPKNIDKFDYKDFSTLGNCWTTYEGKFSYDMKEGVGTLALSNGQMYSGHFKNDKVHGEGVFVSKDRAIHGQWNADTLVSIF